MKLKYDETKWEKAPCNFVNTLQMFITNKCNKRCKGCFYDERLGNKNHISLEDYKSYVLKYKKGINKVILLGGEPTLHPNLKEMIVFNNINNLRTTIYTNGTNLEIFNKINTQGVTIRIGALGLFESEKPLFHMQRTNKSIEITYMLRKDNVYELNSTIEAAEGLYNCKKIMISSIRNISNSGNYWKDGEGDLSFNDYFDIAQNFVDNYNGKIPEIQISIRGNMEEEGGDFKKCRFLNVFPNKDKIICPFDISKNIVHEGAYKFQERVCNKNCRCLLQKTILKRKINNDTY